MRVLLCFFVWLIFFLRPFKNVKKKKRKIILSSQAAQKQAGFAPSYSLLTPGLDYSYGDRTSLLSLFLIFFFPLPPSSSLSPSLLPSFFPFFLFWDKNPHSPKPRKYPGGSNILVSKLIVTSNRCLLCLPFLSVERITICNYRFLSLIVWGCLPPHSRI